MAKIELSYSFFDGGLVEDDELTFKSYESSLTKLFVDVVEKMKSHKALTNPNFVGEKAFEYPENAIPKDDSDVPLEVVFVDNNEVLEYFDVFGDDQNKILGFHALNAGAYEIEDEDVLSAKHRVFVVINEEYYRDFVKQQRQDEIDPSSNRYDIEYLKAYLVTLTHEVAHCVEFIEHANGMSPSEAQNLREAGEIDLDLNDISAGHGILFEFDDSLTQGEIVDIMEERVEEKGRLWLDDIRLDPGLLAQAVKDFDPGIVSEEPADEVGMTIN